MKKYIKITLPLDDSGKFNPEEIFYALLELNLIDYEDFVDVQLDWLREIGDMLNRAKVSIDVLPDRQIATDIQIMADALNDAKGNEKIKELIMDKAKIEGKYLSIRTYEELGEYHPKFIDKARELRKRQLEDEIKDLEIYHDLLKDKQREFAETEFKIAFRKKHLGKVFEGYDEGLTDE